MLQIDHIYEFLYNEVFSDFEVWHLFNGVPKLGDINIHDISLFTRKQFADKKIFFYDQEPFISQMYTPYMKFFNYASCSKALVTSEYSEEVDEFVKINNLKNLYYFFHGFAALDWYRGFYALNYNKLIVKEYKYD